MAETTNISWNRLSVTADSQEIVHICGRRWPRSACLLEPTCVQTSLPSLTLTFEKTSERYGTFVVPHPNWNEQASRHGSIISRCRSSPTSSS